MSLDRFKTAQASAESGIVTALAEIRRGRKTSHWIWYVWPQLVGLARSDTARRYGLADLEEAINYLQDDELRRNLLNITAAAAEHLAAGVPLLELMGSEGDGRKLASCMTLFDAAATRVPQPELQADMSALRTMATTILDGLDAQGVPRCAFTLNEVQAN